MALAVPTPMTCCVFVFPLFVEVEENGTCCTNSNVWQICRWLLYVQVNTDGDANVQTFT